MLVVGAGDTATPPASAESGGSEVPRGSKQPASFLVDKPIEGCFQHPFMVLGTSSPNQLLDICCVNAPCSDDPSIRTW